MSSQILREKLVQKKKKIVINSFNDLLELLKTKKNIPLLIELETNLKVISFELGEIQYDLVENTNSDLISNLSHFLFQHTGERWNFVRIKDNNAKTFNALKKEQNDELKELIDNNEIVQEVLKSFPGSKVVKSSFSNMILC